MKKKLLEAIRSILRKIILPIRRKKEEWLSNFRLSMAFRISMAYLKLMLTHGLLFMMGFFLIYMYSEKVSYDLKAKEIITAFTEKKDLDIFNPYYNHGITIQITDQDADTKVYGDFKNNQASDKDFTNVLIIDRKNVFTVDNIMYTAEFRYDMTESYLRCMSLLWKIVLLYLCIVYLVIRKGKRSDVKLFEPVRIMSATANR